MSQDIQKLIEETRIEAMRYVLKSLTGKAEWRDGPIPTAWVESKIGNMIREHQQGIGGMQRAVLSGAQAAQQACACATWARADCRATNHHPDCMLFKEQVYARVSLEGGGTYVEPLDKLYGAIGGELADAEPGVKLVIELVAMAPEEYARLPEFAGH